ncbi:MAG: hypothetical protein HYY57_01400, partial [Candidatus Omnitrophica bacterium]|nr:hypothetical protein [Candidatus Omnitrophota bacterium]
VTTGFVFLSPTIIFPAHYFLTTSPATYTIHLYELNKDPLGARYWKGEKNRAIDLTEHPILESDIGPTLYNNGLYNLQPALKHTNDGLTLSDVRLTIRISNALKIKVSDYLPRWNVQVVGNYTEYTTVIPTVTNHDLQPTLREFIFHRSGHESFQITYRITGMDDMGRYLRPPETTVTLTKLE